MTTIDLETVKTHIPEIISNYLKWACIKDYKINEEIEPEYYMRENEPQGLLFISQFKQLDLIPIIEGIADKLPEMDIARGCISGYFIGLLGERGFVTRKSTIALLDFFIKIVDLCISFKSFKNETINNLCTLHADEYKASLQMPLLSTAVMSRITTSREYRDYLREKPELTHKICSIASEYGNTTYIPSVLNMAEKERVIILNLELNKGCEVEIEQMDNNFQLFTWFQMELYHNGLLQDYGVTDFNYNESVDNLIHRRNGTDDELSMFSSMVLEKAYFGYYQYSARYLNKEGKIEYNKFDIVCGESNIYEVPKLNDKFIILLSTPIRSHYWNGANIGGVHFSLRPKMKIIRQLNQSEIDEWKNKIEQK